VRFATLKAADPTFRDALREAGVPCESFDRERRLAYPAALLALARSLRRERIDLLHVHLFEPSVIGLLAGVLAGTRARVLTRHYSDYHTRIDRPWHVRLDQLCTRLAHVVIAVSRHTAEHLTGVEGAPARKVRVILNGVDLERARISSPDAPRRLRQELGGGAQLLLVPARLHPEKGHSHLFRALPELRQRCKQPFLVLVAGDGPFRAEYEREVAALGVSDLVRFLGFRHDMPDLMAAADLVVLPSVTEAFGLVLTEALFLGTPVVATRVGGVPEIIADGVDGVLVPPGDSAALAAAIGGLLTSDEARARLQGAGRRKVAETFGFDRMIRGYESLYAELLATTANA
jgi:glycosyltransferase involved in cell wall biosynthesis